MAVLRDICQVLLTGTFWKEVATVRWTEESTGDGRSVLLENPSPHPVTLVAATCREPVPEGDLGRWVASTRLALPDRRHGVAVLHQPTLRPGAPAQAGPGSRCSLALPRLSPPVTLTSLVVSATVEGKAQKYWRLDTTGQVEVLRDDIVWGTPRDGLDGLFSFLN